MMSSLYNNIDLPKQFVTSLKVLFDILDETSCGLVHLSDLESRWKGVDVEGLPKGVVEAWRRVAFPDRQLNFDRFLSGIRVALMQQAQTTQMKKHNKQNNYGNVYETIQNQTSRNTNLAHPDLIAHHNTNRQNMVSPTRQMTRQNSGGNSTQGNHVDRIRSQNEPYAQHRPTVQQPAPSMAKQRTFSMPQLTNVTNSNTMRQNRSFSPNNLVRSNSRDDIVHVLKKWQHNQMDTNKPQAGEAKESIWRNDPRASVASMSALDRYGGGDSKRYSAGGDSDSAMDDAVTHGTKRRVSRSRADGRRHTVTNAVDIQMLRMMKQLEQEKDTLLQGLEMLERARDWYSTQIRAVQDRQKYLGTTIQQDYSLDTHQERVNLQATRISEVNQQLNCLIDSSVKGFSLHMNLARPMNSPHKHPAPPGEDMSKQLQEHKNLVNRLRQQNKQLTEEVGHKSERISKLEQEKTQVVREMFQQQASAKNRRLRYEESSYI